MILLPQWKMYFKTAWWWCNDGMPGVKPPAALWSLQSLGSVTPPNPSLSTVLCLSRAEENHKDSCWGRGGWGRLKTSPGSEQVQEGRTDRTPNTVNSCSAADPNKTIMHPDKRCLSSVEGLSFALKLHTLYLQHLLCQPPKRAAHTG